MHHRSLAVRKSSTPGRIKMGRRSRTNHVSTSTFIFIATTLLVFYGGASNANATAASSSDSTTAFVPSPRIIDGVETPDTRYPYAVSLEIFGEHFCGGSLIAPDVVITAGHCNSAGLGSDTADSTYRVVVGKHDISYYESGNTDSVGEELSVLNEIQHPNYDPDTVDNDFNLIFLTQAVSSSTTSVYLRLNNDNSQPYSGAPLTVVGWGDINAAVDIQTMSNVLMETVVYAMSNEVCAQSEGFVDSGNSQQQQQQQQQQPYTGLWGAITDNMMCAQADGTDACQVRERE